MKNVWNGIGHVSFGKEKDEVAKTEKGSFFSLATTQYYKDKSTGERKDITVWHNIAVFGKLKETVDQYLKKGALVDITGSVSYHNKEKNGVTYTNTYINAKSLIFLDKKPKDETTSIPQEEPQTFDAPVGEELPF